MKIRGDYSTQCPSVYKSRKHIGHNFAYDIPKVWNELFDDVYFATSTFGLIKKKVHVPTIVSNLVCVSVGVTFSMSMNQRTLEFVLGVEH